MKYSKNITPYKKMMKQCRDYLNTKYGIRFISHDKVFIRREYTLSELHGISKVVTKLVDCYQTIKSLEIKEDKLNGE